MATIMFCEKIALLTADEEIIEIEAGEPFWVDEENLEELMRTKKVVVWR